MMKARVATLGAAALTVGLAAGTAAAAPGDPPWGNWGGPGIVVGPPAAPAGSFLAVVLGHGPIGCYSTRVRADNRWLRAEICDWNPGFGAP